METFLQQAVQITPDSPAPATFRCDNFWTGDAPLCRTLADLYGSRPLDSFGGSYGWSVRYRQVEDYEKIGISTLSEYLTAFESGNTPLPYLRHLSVNRAMPALRGMLKLPQAFKPNWANHPLLDRVSGPELFIGQSGTSFGNLHQDQVCVHVGFVQLQGTKEFIVAPPEDAPLLDTFEGREFPWQERNSRLRYSDLVDTDTGAIKSSPARIQRITLSAGEALLLPANWWHTTLNLTDSISYSIRIVNGSNALDSAAAYLSGIPKLFTKRRYQPVAQNI